MIAKVATTPDAMRCELLKAGLDLALPTCPDDVADAAIDYTVATRGPPIAASEWTMALADVSIAVDDPRTWQQLALEMAPARSSADGK